MKELKDATQLGRAAESLLTNKTLDKALNEMQSHIATWIGETELTETDKREELYRLMKTAMHFKNVLRVYLNKGATAQKKLEVATNGGQSSTRP